MELIPFQTEASEEISNNIRLYLEEPLWISKDITLPFYQTLKSITGERVIIVTGCINVLVSRVSGTLTKYNSCIA